MAARVLKYSTGCWVFRHGICNKIKWLAGSFCVLFKNKHANDSLEWQTSRLGPKGFLLNDELLHCTGDVPEGSGPDVADITRAKGQGARYVTQSFFNVKQRVENEFYESYVVQNRNKNYRGLGLVAVLSMHLVRIPFRTQRGSPLWPKN